MFSLALWQRLVRLQHKGKMVCYGQRPLTWVLAFALVLCLCTAASSGKDICSCRDTGLPCERAGQQAVSCYAGNFLVRLSVQHNSVVAPCAVVHLGLRPCFRR